MQQRPPALPLLTAVAVQVCYSRCELCHTTSPENGWADPAALLQHSQQALQGPDVVTVDGRFQALMAVLMPCRSDRSAQVMPWSARAATAEFSTLRRREKAWAM